MKGDKNKMIGWIKWVYRNWNKRKLLITGRMVIINFRKRKQNLLNLYGGKRIGDYPGG